MRLPLAILAACLLAGAASAQTEEKVWTDAPVPGNLPQGTTPADRAGGLTAPDTSAPFSSLPSGARTGSQSNQTTRDGGGPGLDTTTPSVAR